MRRLAPRFELQPQTALVRGDDLQSRRLADNEASTEELRITMINYRAIFDELLLEQEPSRSKVAA